MTEKAKEEESLKEKWLKKNAEILGETDHQESQSILKPIEIDEYDDDLKMNIKIFKLAPVKKNKNSQATTEMRDVMEVETQITLDDKGKQSLLILSNPISTLPEHLHSTFPSYAKIPENTLTEKKNSFFPL